MDVNESVVIMSSVRYAVGRSSYAVGCVIDYVASKKKELSQSNKEVIERDILEAIKESEEFGKVSYKEDWLKLIEFLKK